MSKRLFVLLCLVPGFASAHTLGVAAASWDAVVTGWTLPFESAALVTWMAIIGVLLAHFTRERSVFLWVSWLFLGLAVGCIVADMVQLSEPLALAIFAAMALWVTVAFGLSPTVFQGVAIGSGYIAGVLVRQSHPELMTVWSIQVSALACLVMVPMMIAALLRLPGDRFPTFGSIFVRVIGSWMVALAAMQSAFLIQA